ncbi:hypothetical protein BS78_09G178000 [Paspalum vaginatum]|nr:hypothetical protein BS78_09G178000 [Paspalum vaginatum]
MTASAAALLVAASVLVLASPPSCAAPSPSPAGGIDSACMNSLLNMSDCLTYVTKGSTARRPDAPCCPELAGLVGSDPRLPLRAALRRRRLLRHRRRLRPRARAPRRLPRRHPARLHLHRPWVPRPRGPSCSARGSVSLAHGRRRRSRGGGPTVPSWSIAAGLAAVAGQPSVAPVLRRRPPRHPRHAAARRRSRQRDVLDDSTEASTLRL